MDRIADGGRAVVLPDGRRSEPFREEVTFNKATMKPIRLLTAPHPIRGRRAQTTACGASGSSPTATGRAGRTTTWRP
ncbi:MAG: hypothetical protein ACLRM8_02225 [Alistipes sp.]